MTQRPFIRLMPLLIGGIGLLFAIYLGRLAGQSDYRTLGVIFVTLVVVSLCLWLRSGIWLLIPFCWTLTGRIGLLPLPFNVRDLSIFLVTGMFGIFFALKMIRLKSEIGWLEVLVAINVTYVATMYIRHPVGTSAFGSEMVGGRPYFNIIIGLLAFLLFRLVTINPRQAKIFPFFLLGGSSLITCLNLLVLAVPSLVAVIAPIYSGINVGGYMEAEGYQTASTQEGQRITEFVGPASLVLQILCSYFNPISLLLPVYPVRLTLLLLSCAGILLAGFRNIIITSVFLFLLGCYFQGGSRNLWRGLILGFVTAIVLIVLQVSVGLPLQAQRALSFIPLVPWDQGQKADAEGTTQWRIEMWKIVFHEKKYINDKIWGDGFGFTAYELNIMRDASFGGTGFIGGATQEAFMINGTFHSGPLSAIRNAGFVGLLFFLIWIFFLAFQAPKLIRLAKGTPYFVITLFFAMPVIYAPFLYIFIFGAYDLAFPETLFAAGMYRMIKNSLIAYKETENDQKVTSETEVPALSEARSLQSKPASYSGLGRTGRF